MTQIPGDSEPLPGVPEVTGTAVELARPPTIMLRSRMKEAPGYTDADYSVEWETAEAYIHADAPNTRIAYERIWNNYKQWCSDHGRVALPATAETLMEYVQHLTLTPARDRTGHERPRAPAGILQAVACIRSRHALAGYEEQPPTKQARRILRKYKREWAEAGGKIHTRPPLAGEALDSVLEACAGDSASAVRDRALILAGVYGMFRRSELSQLDIGDFGEADDGDGVILRLRYSKTDQEAEGCDVAIPHDDCEGGYCPACCVRDWVALLAARGFTDGPLFRCVDRHGRIGGEAGVTVRGGGVRMTAQGVDVRVRALARKAALANASAYGGHSLRAGGATAAHLAGVAPTAISAQGRWDPGSTQMLKYIRRVDWDNHPMKGIRKTSRIRKEGTVK